MKPATKTTVWPGALVFLKRDKSKLRARETYIVIKIEEEVCYIKKLKNKFMAENYKVKLTEISLLPNQSECKDDDELSCEPDTNDDVVDNEDNNQLGVKQHDGKLHEYNTRRKPRIDYKKLNEGNLSLIKETPKPFKLVYAWDTPENSDDEDEPQSEQKMQFETWCEIQHEFVPKNSIFIHYFKDKYRELDVNALSDLAQSLLSVVKASYPPRPPSKASSESSSSLDSDSIPGDAASMDWDNYGSLPSFHLSSSLLEGVSLTLRDSSTLTSSSTATSNYVLP